MTLTQQAIEARHKRFLGRSTVRTFGAGQQFQLTQSTLDVLASLKGGQDAQDQTRFLLTSVIHAGINNLPKDLSARILHALSDPADPDEPQHPPLADWVPEEVRTRAVLSGYGNSFEALRAHVPWRVALFSESGAALYPAPRPGGPLTATVVGPAGETSAQGAGEIHTDRLGRIRIRFDFQSGEAQTQPAETSNASTWVRVMQRCAGAGMGWQFIPRVGQEVLVDFMDGSVERPIVIAALYNGQGEAGIAPTPGGAHYVQKKPLDENIVAFFDRYVHDSLAGFAKDATLPSDPRVIYAGGDNKFRYAAVPDQSDDKKTLAA